MLHHNHDEAFTVRTVFVIDPARKARRFPRGWLAAIRYLRITPDPRTRVPAL
jgi:hypothetical protein